MTDTSTALPPLRIVVADDQASVREGLVLLLELLPNIDVIGSAANGREAIELVARHHPDAILLDLHMPVLDGIETTKLLTEQHPEVAIVVLTTYADDVSVLAALGAGARSYLTKDADRTDIANALRGAATGLAVLDPAIQATLVAAATRPTPPADLRPPLPEDLPDDLTRREGEILSMMAVACPTQTSRPSSTSAATPSKATSTGSSPKRLPQPGRRRPLRPQTPSRLTHPSDHGKPPRVGRDGAHDQERGPAKMEPLRGSSDWPSINSANVLAS